MYLNSIELEGFGPFRYNNKINIPDGLVGIVSQYENNPKKSNAGGKSNFLNSILFNFFCTGEFNKIEELVNDHCDSMVTKIDSTINGQRYLTERGIKKGSSYFDMHENKVRVGNDDKKGKTDKSYYQDKMNNLLGMTYDMFSASVFFEQMNMDKFINTEAEKRREYIDKVLNLEMWRSLYKSKVKDIKQFEVDKKDSLDSLLVTKEIIKTIKIKLATKDSVIQNINTITKQRDDLQLLVRDYIQFKSTREQYINLSAMLNHHKDTYENLNKRLVQLNLDLEKENSLIIEGDTVTLKSEIESIKKLLINNKGIEDNLSTRIKNININLNSRNTIIHTLRSDILINEKSLTNILEGTCPVCKQDINKSLLEEHDNNVKNIIINLNKKMEEETEEFKKLENEREEIAIHYHEILLEGVSLSDQIKTKEFDIQRVQFNIKAKNEKLKSITDQIVLVENDVYISKNKLQSLDTEVKRLKELLPVDNSIFDNIDSQEEEIKKLEIKLSELNIELGQIKEYEHQLEEKEKKVISIENNLQEIEEKLYIYNILAEVYKIIPKNILKDSIQSIEELANEIIQQILPELSVKIYEDEEKKSSPLVIAFEENGKYRSYKRLSGGQKTIVNIGLRLGFSKIISERSKTKIDCIIMDEPFGALDEENRELVKKCLTFLTGYFRQILVITHTDDIKEFPNVITIFKDEDNVSWIR